MTAVAGTPILARYFQDENDKNKWSANWIEMESAGSSYDFYWQSFSFFSIWPHACHPGQVQPRAHRDEVGVGPVEMLKERVAIIVDCKTVHIFAYSSKREQSNKRSGTRLKTESETGERRLKYDRFFFSRLTGEWGSRASRVRLSRHAVPISLLILRKKPTVLQSTIIEWCHFW